MWQAAEDEPRRLRPERGGERDLLPLARRHREDAIHAGDLAAHPDGEGADTVTLVIHVAADGPAGASLGAEQARRRDAVAAEESDHSGRRYRRGKERGGNEKRRSRPGMHRVSPSRRVAGTRALVAPPRAPGTPRALRPERSPRKVRIPAIA